MDLFQTLQDFKPYLFRIVDNGGATYDRITVLFCDGDGIVCSASTICAHVESIDPQSLADDVESGEGRDLRWIDLDPYLQKRIIADCNEGFGDLDGDLACATRDEAGNYDGCWYPNSEHDLPIYRDGDKFKVKDSDRAYSNEPDESFDSFREAFLYILPDESTLAGPEYQSTVDLWDETGGPAPAWDCETDPATPFEVAPWAIERETMPIYLPNIGEARDPDHAKEIGDQWRRDNPELALKYQPAYISKVNRVVHRMEPDNGDCGQCEGIGTTQSASNLEDEPCPVCDGTGKR